MKPPRNNRQTTLAKIHIAKQQLGLDDDSYRDRLQQLTGQRSCSEMGIGDLFRVLKHLENCGFKAQPSQTTGRPLSPRGEGRGEGRGERRGRYSSKSQGRPIDVLRALWIQMAQAGQIRDGSEAALLAWVKRATSRLNGGVGVDSLEWLARDEAMTARVINALKGWRKRLAIEQAQQEQP